MKSLYKVLPLLSGAFCAVLLALLLADLLWPRADIFLNGFVKVFLLVTCLLASACAVLILRRRRAWERGAGRK